MPSDIAFTIGPLAVRWYGILIASSLLIGTKLALVEAQRQGLDEDTFLNLVLIGAPLGVVGSRIYYVIFNWDYYRHHLLEIPKIWEGGLAIHGGIIAAVLVGLWYARRHQLNFWQLADIAAPSLILGQSIGRWGNFFNQEAYGYPTSLPWAMYIAGDWRHPTFLYESIWNFLVFLFLLRLRRQRNLETGDVFLAYLGLYSIGRFIVEGFRTDSLMLGSLRAAQVISVVIIAALVFIYWYRRQT